MFAPVTWLKASAGTYKTIGRNKICVGMMENKKKGEIISLERDKIIHFS